MNATAEKLDTRWMIQRDLPAVFQIERLTGGLGWEDEDFRFYLRRPRAIGVVSELTDGTSITVVGSMFYEIHTSRIELANLSVHPEWKRCGVGANLIDRLKRNISRHRRNRICVNAPEDWLGAQLFFKRQGFNAVRIVSAGGEDAYRMVYRLAS